MARSIFVSFHYQRDIFRVNVVRNHFLTKGTYTASGYWDHSLWEETKKQGEDAIKRMINKGLDGTTVTVVLIGAETAGRKWVMHEINESFIRGNGMVGIYVNNIRDARTNLADPRGTNPFDLLYVERGGYRTLLSQLYKTYDWVYNDGFNNFGNWIEQAAKDAGK